MSGTTTPTLATIETALAAETSVEQSVVMLLGTLSNELTTALANQDTAAMQAIITQLNTNASSLAAAVAANTPAASAKP